jgi:hypothetical protein
MLPGFDVAMYVTVPKPKSVGGVNVTEADVPVTTDAVPIVGAPGLLDQVPAEAFCICACNVNAPENLVIISYPYLLKGSCE